MKKTILLMALFSIAWIDQGKAESLSTERQDELRNLLLDDCGACHGMTMKGGLGPALTPETLANKSDAFLIDTIKKGRENTPMPPWEGILNATEIKWLVGELKRGVNP